MDAGTAANSAEERKGRNYVAFAEAHQFEPITVETMGVYGGSIGVILRAIGRRLIEATGEPREAKWFRRNLAIAIQRGNAFGILSTGKERGVEVHPTPHFVPEGNSQSFGDFMLVFNFEVFNPLVPSAHKSVRLANIFILKLEGIIKKFHMSVATMSRQTKRAYLRLQVPKNDDKIFRR